MPKKLEPRYINPTLESITLRGKYELSLTDFKDVLTYLQKTLVGWIGQNFGNSIRLLNERGKKYGRGFEND